VQQSAANPEGPVDVRLTARSAHPSTANIVSQAIMVRKVCQKQTSGVLLDDLVGKRKQLRRDFDTERLGCLDVEGEVKLVRL
jgi:hypothetical protein